MQPRNIKTNIHLQKRFFLFNGPSLPEFLQVRPGVKVAQFYDFFYGLDVTHSTNQMQTDLSKLLILIYVAYEGNHMCCDDVFLYFSLEL